MGLLVDDAAIDKSAPAYALFAQPISRKRQRGTNVVEVTHTEAAPAEESTKVAMKKEKVKKEKAAKKEKAGKKETGADEEKIVDMSTEEDGPVAQKEGPAAKKAKPVRDQVPAEGKPKKGKAVPEDALADGKQKQKLSFPSEEDPERLARTAFVGNLPLEVERHALSRHFSKYGPVESVRIRSAAAANPKMTQKAAVIKRELDATVRDAVNAYVVFASVESLRSAVADNGAVAFGRHLRIDAAGEVGSSSAGKRESSSSVFLGNLPFDTQARRLACPRVTVCVSAISPAIFWGVGGELETDLQDAPARMRRFGSSLARAAPSRTCGSFARSARRWARGSGTSISSTKVPSPLGPPRPSPIQSNLGPDVGSHLAPTFHVWLESRRWQVR
jgi:hypothetical protein